MSIVARSIAGLLLAFTLLASAVTARAEALNVQGLWWTAPAGSEAGTGINFAHQGDVILATWFVFDAERNPQWFVAELHKTAEGEYTGALARAAGDPRQPTYCTHLDDDCYPLGPIASKPGNVVETVVGTLTASFADDRHGSIAYTVGGIGATKPIVPQEFPTRPTCVYSANPDLAGAANYTDLWWNPGGPGWGVNFSHQGNVILATWFTFDAAGKSTWLVALLLKNIGGVYAGQVFRVSGPPLGGPFDPSTVVEAVAGTAIVRFADGNHASFSYDFGDFWDSKPITRQLFAPPAGTVCQGPAPAFATLSLCESSAYYWDPFDEGAPVEGCNPVAVPYSRLGGRDMVLTEIPKPASIVLAGFTLGANDGPVTITNVSAFDAVNVVTPFFVGLTEGMVIAAGETVTIELHTPPTGGRTANPRFAFSANGEPALDYKFIVRIN